jgi:hypothetical protein
MYVRNSSHDMLLNTTYMQAYFSVQPIVFKSANFQDKATILPAQIPFRYKNNNNGTSNKKLRNEHVSAMIGFFAFRRQTSQSFIMTASKLFCLASAKRYLKFIYSEPHTERK